MLSTLLTEQWLGLGIGPIAMIITLVFVGELLLALEFFVIPGFGAGGILGFGAIIAAAIIAGVTFGPLVGVIVFLFSALVSIAGLIFGMKTKTIQSKFVLGIQQKSTQGTIASDLINLKGAKGVTLSDLRPSGVALIGEKRVDVVSDGDYIDNDTEIEVLYIEGPRVVVKEFKE